MQYKVWSRGELIGETDLGFRGLGFDGCRSGHFLPNARGEKLMDELASDSHCMRAYMHRNYRDADGNDLLDPEYVNCDWFADVAEHLRNSALLRQEPGDAHVVSEVDRKLLAEMLADDEEQMEGGEYFSTPCDITMPVDWGYDDHQGDNELGSGWNTALRDVPDFPRYQIHVILAGE